MFTKYLYKQAYSIHRAYLTGRVVPDAWLGVRQHFKESGYISVWRKAWKSVQASA